MKRLWTLIVIVAGSMFFTTGCWDRTEMNDLAVELGWGLDLAKDDSVQISSQFIIPSKLVTAGKSGNGGNGKAYFVATGTGKDTIEAVQNMQTKLSRHIFRGHRRVIAIGEPLARHGLSSVLDTYSRDPEIRLRADAFVVKGDTAEEFLERSYPLESVPAEAALKLHQQIGGLGDVAFRNFLIDASTEGSYPTLPVMKLISTFSQQKQESDGETTKGFAYAGRAVFDQNLKLIGYLNPLEAKEAFWVKGQLKFLTLSGFVPQGKGDVSLDLTKLGTKIQPSFRGNHITFFVALSGTGMIRENNTNLDLTQTKNIRIVENALDKETQQEVQDVIKKTQQEYKADIFGFGESIHRKYPNQWKALKKNWDKKFPDSDIAVTVNFTVQRVGLTGPSLQLKQDQIKK